MDYSWNESAERMAERIIEQHHQRLNRIKIAHLFKLKPPPKKHKLRDGKKLILAKTSKVSDKHRVLMEGGYIFIIEYDQYWWDELSLDQQKALVDHELCHAGNDDEGPYL